MSRLLVRPDSDGGPPLEPARPQVLPRPPVHAHEADRLESLRTYAVLDTAPEPAFDALVHLAARLCDAPSSVIGLIDDDRQWYKAAFGVAAQQVPRDEAFCAYAVATGDRLVVPDARLDARFADNPAVLATGGVRGYAGVPLVGRDGLPLGTLCVFDHRPREFGREQLDALQSLAEQAVALLELRRSDLRQGLVPAPDGDPGAVAPGRLRAALERGELTPAFQPVVDLVTGRLEGLEALLRWDHPERGRLLPAAFLPAVESSGLVLPVGRRVLDRALTTLALIRATYPAADRLRMAVNVSPAQLARPGLADVVTAALARHGVPAGLLMLELTETVPLDDIATACSELGSLRDAGVEVAIDDYGSGNSSLARLLTLPVSVLKLDRFLVQRALQDPRARAVLRSTLSLADELGLDVIAEGVETQAERQALVDLGCRQGQGFLFSRAVGGADFEDYLAREYAADASGDTG